MAQALDAVVDASRIADRLEVAVHWPALQDRKTREIDVVTGAHDLLHRACLLCALRWDA